jgi:small basic protein
MIALPLVALLIGFMAVYRFLPPLPVAWADYIAVAVLAGFDALIGGLRARIEQRFDEAVFVTGFFANVVLAAALAYLGDKLGVDLYLAVVVALGIRIFTNLGRIRGLVVEARLEARRSRASASPQ